MRWIALALLAFAGCSNEVAPAQRVISEIDRSIRAAAPEAAQYVPEQLSEVQRRLGMLRAAFERNDYAAVISGAPAVMDAAQALGGAAAARKNVLLKQLNDDWSVLAAEVPNDVSEIQGRLDALSRSGGKKPAGIDVDAARARLSRDVSLWSKAQAAYATGNLDEAVNTAKLLKSRLHGLAGSLPSQPESAAIRRPASPR